MNKNHQIDPSKVQAVLFDIDGTLVSYKNHCIEPSTLKAIASLQKKGIACIVATGRAEFQLTMMDPSIFDAFVTLNGQYCFTKDNKVLVDRPLEHEAVQLAYDQTKAGLYAATFIELDRHYSSFENDRIRTLCDLVGEDLVVAEDIDRALTHPVYQLNLYLTKDEEHIYTDLAHGVEIPRWSELFCDVIPAGGGKAAGAEVVLAQMGYDPANCIAFGDGGNDLTLFELVGMPIAMGNGTDEIKCAAWMVTDDCDHDGIYNALHKLGLVEE